MRSKLKWNELSDKGFTKEKICHNDETHEYQVIKPGTESIWPESRELIAWCNGFSIPKADGIVCTYDDKANVSVYVD
jgi:hypothetical protein